MNDLVNSLLGGHRRKMASNLSQRDWPRFFLLRPSPCCSNDSLLVLRIISRSPAATRLRRTRLTTSPRSSWPTSDLRSKPTSSSPPMLLSTSSQLSFRRTLTRTLLCSTSVASMPPQRPYAIITHQHTHTRRHTPLALAQRESESPSFDGAFCSLLLVSTLSLIGGH